MRPPSPEESAHRPWALPVRPWIGEQTWNDLAFLHWPVSAAAVRPLVPAPLAIDQHEGTAWVAVTPFWMSGVALRGWPALPGVSTFPELNVRTYVTLGDRPGVWFFSLDAGSALAVWAARLAYHLPYVRARMRVRPAGASIDYHSERPCGAGFSATYEATGPVFRAAPGSLAHWLTERYCLYARSSSGGLYRAEIHHVPWPLRPGRAEVRRNDLLAVNRLSVSGEPALVHFAKRLEVLVWLPVRIG